MAPGRKRGANKSIAKEELRLGDLVLAKVKGFPAWPAKIARPEDWDHVPDPKKYFVHFFGTQEIAFVTPADIQAFTSEAKKKVLERCQGKTVKYFAQAVEEILAVFEESQNHHKSDMLGNVALLNAAEPKICDGTDHREASNDGNTDKFNLVENNGAEIKPDIGEEDSSFILKCLSSEPLEHGSPDAVPKVADFDSEIDGVTCTEQRDGAGKNSVAGDLAKQCKDEVDRAKRVPDSRASTENHFLGPNQKFKSTRKESFGNKVVSDHNIDNSKKSKELLKEKSNIRVCGDKIEYALVSKSGILGKKKRFESETGNSVSEEDESKNAAKRPRSEDAKDQKQCKSRRRVIVGEGKPKGSISGGVASILKREVVLGVSARGGKVQFDKETVAYTKRQKQSVDHTSGSTFPGFGEKEGTTHSERKASSSPGGNAKVQAAQLPKRRRAVYISDEDDDEDPKTPVHGGDKNVPKGASAFNDGPKVVKGSHDTPVKARRITGSAESAETAKASLNNHNKDASLARPVSMEGLSYNSLTRKPVTELLPKNVKPIMRSPKKSSQLLSVKKQVSGHVKTEKLSGMEMTDRMEGISNSKSKGKPVIKSPLKNVKQNTRSPMKSPQLVSIKDQVAGQNKIAKVTSMEMAEKCPDDSSKDAVAGSDRVSSSQSQIAKESSKPAVGEELTVTPKVATHMKGAVNLSHGMIDVKKENGSAPMISSGMPESSSSMKDLIAAAQAKRKQAHSHATPLVNLDTSVSERKVRSHSPCMVQNVSSPAGDAMLIVAQGHQEDRTPSNFGNHPSSNQAETEEKEGRKSSPGHISVGGSLSGDTEAAISRDAFEGMIETLSRTRESIGRATRQAIVCAKYGIASEVVELLIRKLEIEPQFRRKVDLFFLVDSITQCSHSQKGRAGAMYIPTVQAALPRLLGAAAPPGTGARENRHQCRKVLRLWLERKIFPDSLLRRYIGDIGASGDDATVGFTLRRPSRSERSLDDPIRGMEGMLFDEYGSNSSFQVPGLFSSYTFGDDEEDEDLPGTSQEVRNTHIEKSVLALVKLEAPGLEDANGVLEMDDASCQPRDEVPSHVCEIKTKENSAAATSATTATELPLSPECSPPLPLELPPSPPPLPPCPPPPSPSPPPSSPLKLPPPPSEKCSPPTTAPLAHPPPPPSHSTTLLPSPIPQPSVRNHPSLPLPPGFAPQAYPLLQHEYQISMKGSSITTGNQIVQNPPRHTDGDMFFKHEASLQNQRRQPRNTSFQHSPMTSNHAPAPSSHFSLPSRIVHSKTQRSSFPHPYPFTSQPVDGQQRHINEDRWQMPSNGRSADTQNGIWISGRNPLPGSFSVTDGFFQPPPERLLSGTISYQPAANNLQASHTFSGHTASQILPSRPDIPSAARWRTS